MTLTVTEKKLAAAIEFDVDVCKIVKQHTGGKLARLTALTEDFKERKTDGFSVDVSDQDVEPMLAKIQPQLTARGYRAFSSETYESNGARKSKIIAVLKTTDQYSILSIRHPSGGNYDVSAQDVVDRLRRWEKTSQFNITGAGGAWVAIQFETLPKDICAFAEEIYDFCPDTVDQGVGLQNESDDPKAFAAARKLFPKLSAKMQKKLNNAKAEFAKMKLPPEIRMMLESNRGGFSFTTPTDMGIRLLAYHLKQTRQLFLWWD